MTLKTERTRVRRIPERGHYDKEIILPTNDTYQDLLNIIPLQIGSYFTSIKNNIISADFALS